MWSHGRVAAPRAARRATASAPAYHAMLCGLHPLEDDACVKLHAIGVLGLLASCGSPAASPPPSSVPIAPAASAPAAPAAPRAARPPAARIESGGIGDIRVGRGIPARYLSDAADARRRYDIRWVADAQPFEAFRIDDPPVVACFEGPFEQWAKDNVGELRPERFVDDAIAAAKAGAPVTFIVIEKRGPVTESGIGVGSSWEDVQAAHPSAKVLRDPEWFEPRPTCRARLPALPGVEVLLERCDDEYGAVERVLIGR